MDYINSKLLIVAKNENIAPRDQIQGMWLTILLPMCIILSAIKHPLEASQNYKIQSSISVSLLLSSILFTIGSCHNKSLNALKIQAAILTAIHLLANGSTNIFIIAGTSTLILCYERLLLFLMKKCPNTFTFGEASVIVQGIILYFSSTLLTVFYSENITESNIQIASSVIQMGLMTIAVLSLTAYKVKLFRRTIPFYLLLSFLIFIFLVFFLYGLIKQSAFVWILNLFVASDRRVYLTFYWVISVTVATLTVTWQISRAKKATTISRKIFHVLAVMVFIPGLLYECTIMFLASGVVFGILLFIEIVRLLNVPPFGESLQEIFIVYSDDKDNGTFALTQLYLLVGCSLPLWIHPAMCDVSDSAGIYLVPMLSGLLSIGVGDTAASVAGVRWGRHTWTGTRKTVEGTLGCIICQLLLIAILHCSDFLLGMTRLQFYKAIVAIIVTSLVEARTSQIDNLALPLIMYILLI